MTAEEDGAGGDQVWRDATDYAASLADAIDKEFGGIDNDTWTMHFDRILDQLLSGYAPSSPNGPGEA